MGAADAALDGIPVGRDTRSIAARCFRTGRSQVVVDVISDPDYLMVDPSVRSQLHVLLRAGGRRLGVIVVSSDIIDGFSDNDARLLERAAAELAQVLEHARLGEVQRETIDDLQRLSTMKDDSSRSRAMSCAPR
jgi:putative methionine-R-sulfoxide reductase with GAF domain